MIVLTPASTLNIPRLVYDPNHDTGIPKLVVKFHPEKLRWVNRVWGGRVTRTRAWLEKRVTWIDDNGVKHSVKWQVRHSSYE